MKTETITFKLFTIGVIAGACFVASLFVLGLISEREGTHQAAKMEIGRVWGAPQTIVGPMLVFKPVPTPANLYPSHIYVLPSTVKFESTLVPEIRSRGIFETVVYSERVRVSGAFSKDDLQAAGITAGVQTFAVSISDTRSIETQLLLDWQGSEIPFHPGVNAPLLRESGIHAFVPLTPSGNEYSFAFTLDLQGSEQAQFAPVGGETEATITSTWREPEFIGAFLPSERNITASGFNALWKVSSFGKSYPQSFHDDDKTMFETMESSAFGVKLYEGVDLYTQIFRSVKYALLFIVITFAAFFLFEILLRVRLHPVHYLLIGSALALFYLLLLSLSEHIGFLYAYIAATLMTTLLITGYSLRVLMKRSRAITIFALLISLYGYLYFVLQLEDYALLFGSFLLFGLLGAIMYLTRNIDWFAVSKSE